MTLIPYILIFVVLFGTIGIYGKARFDGLLIAVSMCALWFLYGVYGCEFPPRSIFEWLVAQWRQEGFELVMFMPLFSLYVVFDRRRLLAAAPKSPSVAGLGVAAASIALHVLAFRAQTPGISAATVVVAAWGMCYAMWGWRVARLLLFPAGYVLLCFTNHVFLHAVPSLRLYSSIVTEWLLNGVGIETVREGTMLSSSTGRGFTLVIVDGCSGLRSLVTMTALAPVHVYFYAKGVRRRWLLFPLSVPFAILANLVRLFAMAGMMAWIGTERAMPLWHDYSGYLVFVLAMLMLFKARDVLAK